MIYKGLPIHAYLGPKRNPRAVKLPKRVWRQIEQKNPQPSQVARVRLVTYNVLAHAYTVGWFALHYEHDLSLLQDW